MPSTAPIKVPIRGVDKYSKDFAKMNAKVARMGRNIKAAGRTMTTALTLPIVAFGATAVRSGIQFDDIMRSVQAKSGATEKDLKAIRAEAKKLGAETRWTAVQAGEGFDKLAMAGWEADDMLKAMRPTLNLAAASNSEVALTADIMSDTMGAFRIEASQAAHVADVMAAALTGANIDMETYKDSMKYAAPIAKEFGMSLEETSAAVGFLGNVGIKGAQAGTTMRKVMLSLATASGGASRELKKLGVHVEGDDGKIRTFIDIMGDMSNAFVDQGYSQKKMLGSLDKIFGTRAITGAAAMSSALQDGGNSLVKLTTNLNKLQPGKVQAMADIMEGGAGGDWRRMVSAFEAMQLAFVESGLLEDLALLFKDLATWMRELSKKDPEALKDIAKALGAVAVLGPALMITGQAITVFSTIAGSIGPAKAAIVGLAQKLGLLKAAGVGASASMDGVAKGAPKLGSSMARIGPMVGIATAAFVALKFAMDDIDSASKGLDRVANLRKEGSEVAAGSVGKSIEEQEAALEKIKALQRQAREESQAPTTTTEKLAQMFGSHEAQQNRLGTERNLLKLRNKLEMNILKARLQADADRLVNELEEKYPTKPGSESKIVIEFDNLPDGAKPKIKKQKGSKVEVKDKGSVMQGAL